MPKFQLTQAAVDDLIEIARYGDRQFGRAASDRFKRKLEKRFQLLADKPLMYPPVSHIHEGYRRSVVEGLSIYYRLSDSGVLIVRVIGRQDFNVDKWDDFH